MPRKEISIPLFNNRSVDNCITYLIYKRYLASSKSGHITITESGNIEYARLLGLPVLPYISLDQAMTIFTKRAKPKGIKALYQTFYKGYSQVEVKSKVQYLLKRLLDSNQIVVYCAKQNKRTYVHAENPLAKTGRLSDKVVQSVIETNNKKDQLPLFYTLLPGTLTAHEGEKKRYLY